MCKKKQLATNSLNAAEDSNDKTKKNWKIYESDEDLLANSSIMRMSKQQNEQLENGDDCKAALNEASTCNDQSETNKSNSINSRSNRSSLKLSSSANPIISSNHDKAAKIINTTINTTTNSQIPSFSFNDDDDLTTKDNNNDSKDNLENPETANNSNENLLSASSGPKLTSFYSKFITGSNIMTDRGCIVNVRTGSFNLGCQVNSLSSSSLIPGEDSSSSAIHHSNIHLNDTELIDSSHFFSSLQHHNHASNNVNSSNFDNNSIRNNENNNSTEFMRNSNYSVRTPFNSKLDNNYSSSSNNVLIPLLLVTQCRKKSFSGDTGTLPTCTRIGMDANENVISTRSNESLNKCLFEGVVDSCQRKASG